MMHHSNWLNHIRDRQMDHLQELLESDNKGEIIYARLANDLMNGMLLPNERLKIRDLAEKMGTSVTPVRDAVLRLVQDGALIMPSPRDIRVRSLTLTEYLEIRSIRMELEGMVAAKAALLATPADIEKLEQMLVFNESALSASDSQKGLELNQSFHFELCRIAQMPILTSILHQLWIKIGPLIAQSYTKGGRHMIDYHYLVVRSIREKDPQAAKIAIQTDLLSGGNVMLQLKLNESNE